MKLLGSASIALSDVAPAGEMTAAAAAYLVHLGRVPCSPNTINSYDNALRPFLAYVASRGVTKFSEISRVLIEDWQNHLATTPTRLTKKPMSPRSRSLAASVIRNYFLWSAKMEKCDAKYALWLDRIKLPALEPRPLKRSVILRIKVFFLDDSTDERYLLERALFFFILGTGCRVSEALRVPRVGWERATIIQKGGSRKTVICPDFAADMMRAYLATRTDSVDALFVRRWGSDIAPMTPTSVRRIWTALTKKLGVQRFTTHQLRHSAATALLAAGVDSMTVTNFMGHKSPATLRIYGEIPEAQRQIATSAMNQFLLAG